MMAMYGARIVAKHNMTDRDDDELARLAWGNMTLKQMLKWRWYFEYRACLIQVRYPRAWVRLSFVKEKPDTRTALNIAQNRLTACRSTLTKHLNRIDKAREQWRQDDPMGLTKIEDTPNWKKVVAKTVRLKHELLEAELTVKRIKASPIE